MKTKAQSALEYMMTYGWAILIIVIVAAVLYSLGIFSPSSSVGATQTGFAPFTATASSCSSTGFKVAFSVGGLPAGASDVSILNASITSATGLTPSSILVGTVGAFSPIGTTGIAASGQTFIANFTSSTCSASGVHYSAAITMWYSYTASGLSSTVPAKGTVSGTSS